MAAADVLLVMITISMMAATAAAKGKGFLDPASTHYLVLGKKAATGQERLFCLARGRCRYKIIQCPRQCPHRARPLSISLFRILSLVVRNLQIGFRIATGTGRYATTRGSSAATASRSICTSSAPAPRAAPATSPGCRPSPSCSTPTLSWSPRKRSRCGTTVSTPSPSAGMVKDIAIDPPSTDGEAEWQAEVTKEIIEDKSQKTKVAAVVVVVIERTATTNSIRVAVDQRNARDGRKSGADHGGGRPEARVPHTDWRHIRAPRDAVQIRRPDGQSGGNSGPDVPAGLREHREEGRGDADDGGRRPVPHAVVPRDGLRRLPLPPLCRRRRRRRRRIFTILNLLTLVYSGLLSYLL